MVNMKKIIVLTKYFGYGYTGATSSTASLISNWIQDGVAVDVFTLNVFEKSDNANSLLKVRLFKTKGELLAKLRREKNSDTMGYSDDHLGWLFSLVGMPYVHTYHGNWPAAMWQKGLINKVKGCWFIPQYAITLYKAKWVVNISELSETFTKQFNKRTQVIRNGVAGEDLESSNKQLSFKYPLHAIAVGGVDQRKYGNLVKMCENKLIDSRVIDIDIYGRNLDEQLKRKVEKFDFVHYKGFSRKIDYNKYDVLLSFSSAENLPIAIVEAAVAGVPHVTFNVGAVSEIESIGHTGVMVEHGDLQKFCEVIRHLGDFFSNNSFDNEQILEEFSWSKSAKKYLKIFDEAGK